jgi:uncharacterized protein YjbJ (UPF0337 family)
MPPASGQARSPTAVVADDERLMRDQLIGRIQEVYGITKEASERQIAQWQADQKEARMVEEAHTVKSANLKDV